MFKKNNKGQVGFYIVFLFIALTVILIGAVASPLGAAIATDFYSAGEDLLLDTQLNTIPDIQDDNVRNALNATFTSATSAATTNIDVAAGMYQYSWIFVLVLVGIVIFLVARQTVAFSSRVI